MTLKTSIQKKDLFKFFRYSETNLESRFGDMLNDTFGVEPVIAMFTTVRDQDHLKFRILRDIDLIGFNEIIHSQTSHNNHYSKQH